MAKKDDVEPLNGSETRDKSSRHVSFSPLENMETERPESNVWVSVVTLHKVFHG